MTSARGLGRRHIGISLAALTYSGACCAARNRRPLQRCPTEHRTANLYQDVLLALRESNAFGICMSIDGTSPNGGCDVAATELATHNLIVKSVQNLP